MWFGSGYMVEYDRIIPAPGSGDPPEVVEHRWTNYASARLAVFDGRLLLQNTIYVQPRFDAPADLRILEELEALAKLTTVFGLGATFSVVHDSAPPSAIVPTDLRLSTSVRLSF